MPKRQPPATVRSSLQPRALAAIAAATLVAIVVMSVVMRDPQKRSTSSAPPEEGAAENEDNQIEESFVSQLQRPERAPTAADRSSLKLEDIPFDGAAAYEHLKAICELGPRPSGSAGMKKQQQLLAAHFEKLGGKVEMQEFVERHPLDGSRVPMANMIVVWHPERKERILLAAHYDTRPLPDRETDPRKLKQPFLGANDGASGVALLMQLGHAMAQLEGKYGVDFVLFDGEELVYYDPRAIDPRFEDRGEYFLGSRFFSREYRRAPPAHRYVCGVLVDMVADADLQLYQDRLSMSYRDARPIVAEIWKVAKSLGVREFIHALGHNITDDHLMLNEIAGIPTIDIIDFDYPRPGGAGGGPYWHTLKDSPQNCSSLSLAKVGWVVHQWLKLRQAR